MDVKKTELKDTELNSIVLNIEDILEEKAKCDIMLGVTNIVTECYKNPPSFEESKAIHAYCRPYALQYAELSDNPVCKLMAKLLLE